MLPVLVVLSPLPRRHFGAAAGGVHPIIMGLAREGRRPLTSPKGLNRPPSQGYGRSADSGGGQPSTSGSSSAPFRRNNNLTSGSSHAPHPDLRPARRLRPGGLGRHRREGSSLPS